MQRPDPCLECSGLQCGPPGHLLPPSPLPIIHPPSPKTVINTSTPAASATTLYLTRRPSSPPAAASEFKSGCRSVSDPDRDSLRWLFWISRAFPLPIESIDSGRVANVMCSGVPGDGGIGRDPSEGVRGVRPGEDGLLTTWAYVRGRDEVGGDVSVLLDGPALAPCAGCSSGCGGWDGESGWAFRSTDAEIIVAVDVFFALRQARSLHFFHDLHPGLSLL